MDALDGHFTGCRSLPKWIIRSQRVACGSGAFANLVKSKELSVGTL